MQSVAKSEPRLSFFSQKEHAFSAATISLELKSPTKLPWNLPYFSESSW